MFNPFRSTPDPNRLDAETFKQRREDDNAVVIDVRTPGEIADGYVEGADHIDFMAGDFRERVEALDKDKTYYLYCRSGNRSGKAANIMRQLGFDEAYNVGGFGELVQAGLPVSRD